MPEFVDFDFQDLTTLENKVRKFIRKVPESVRDLQRQAAAKLVEKIQANASGRPGPDVITGGYRASWSVSQTEFRNGRTVETTVGTNHPAAARLEYGFVGVDSLGRHYSQPPFPHIRPALYEYYAEFDKEFADAVLRDWETS